MNEIKNSKFFTGGHALFTVDNGKGKHYTFNITKKDETKPFFVGLLTGPNNESDYTYVGILSTKESPFHSKNATFVPIKDDVQLALTQKSKYTAETDPVKVLRWAIAVVKAGKELPEGYSIKHEGKCCRCGRTLTDPVSIELGIGPICRDQNW